jgi:hypothetical protein
MALPNWPAYTDDSGTGQDGTDVNASLLDDIHDAITDELQSVANPSVTARVIIDEVVQARGSRTTLDTRLDQSINEDGTLKSTAVQAAITGFRNFGLVNLLGNDTFLLWPSGDTSAPDYWVMSGGGAAVQRCGNGLADTQRKHNSFCARLTGSGSAEAQLTQTVITAGDYAVTTLRNRYLAFGVRCKTTVPGQARMIISDGVSSHISTLHTGGAATGPEADGWEWLYGVFQVGASSTQLFVQLVAPQGTAAYFSGATLVFADVAPADWVPALMTRHTLKCQVIGNVAVATVGLWNAERSGIVQNVTATVGTATSGAAMQIEVETWDGAAMTSMFASPLTVNAATAGAKSPPDGTYARRCLQVQGGTTKRTNGVIQARVTVDDGGNTGANLALSVDYDAYERPLDQIRAL